MCPPLASFLLFPSLSAELLSWVLICPYSIFSVSALFCLSYSFRTHSAPRGRPLLFLYTYILASGRSLCARHCSRHWRHSHGHSVCFLETTVQWRERGSKFSYFGRRDRLVMEVLSAKMAFAQSLERSKGMSHVRECQEQEEGLCVSSPFHPLI